MIPLKDIISLKANEIGGMAALAKKMNWGSEKNPTSAITKYVNGVIPRFDFAIKWREAFKENLIDLMFADEKLPVVNEPEAKYSNLKDELLTCQAKLIACQEENKKLTAGKEELKNFTQPVGRKS